MRCGIILISWFWAVSASMAKTNLSSHWYDDSWQVELLSLASQLDWRDPKLNEGDYEVRIWHRYELVKGAAHGAYIIRKTDTKVSVEGYRIRYSEKGRPNAIHYRPKAKPSLDIWRKLVDNHLLTLPTWSDVEARHVASFPKDSTWSEVATDGVITVKARKTRRRVFISDGESYAFSVFSHDKSRFYTYSNPSLYVKEYADIPELHDVIGILRELNSLF